jgi:sulfide:quinone oxidoreductase
MYPWLQSGRERPRALVAGGGVAALETCLALRAHLGAEELDIEMLTPQARFGYRPLAVLEPFGSAPAWSMSLKRFAADQDVVLTRDRLAEVLPGEHAVATEAGVRRPYDALIVTVGAHPAEDVPGALGFAGSADTPGLRRLLDDAARQLHPRIAFAVGAAASWPLPVYELALLTAAELRDRGVDAAVTLVTPEPAPLALFGARASALVSGLLEAHDIAVMTGVTPVAVEDRELRLRDGRGLPADHVVALPRAAGRYLAGLPHDADGFVPVDAFGRVDGLENVWAAGDITSFPFKQGGLATQQADAAAESVLAWLGLPIEPRPFEPVLQGVLLAEGAPAYLRAPLGDSAAAAAEPRSCSLWWPPSKIAGRYLSSYLTIRAGAPRAPEVRPSSDVVPVRVDLGAAAGVTQD